VIGMSYEMKILSEERVGERRRLEILYGPQHPASGHMRLFIEVDGDVIVNVEPDPGYVHRTMEKLCENKIYIQNIPLFERLSLPDPINVTLAYVHAVEKLAGIDVSPRAKYLRIIMAELSRISCHLYDLGIGTIFLGSSTGYMWCFGLRELVVQLFALATGSRTAPTYVIPGGVRYAPPKAFYEKTLKFLDFMERKLKEFYTLVLANPIAKARLKEVGILTKEDAARLGATGFAARASGINYDIRRVFPYEIYDQFEWDVVVRDEGDSLARLLNRYDEIFQSARIIRQAIKQVPMDGPLVGNAIVSKISAKLRPRVGEVVKLPQYITMRIPKGEAIGITEGGRGAYYYHVISDGTEKPYRIRIITPSWLNLRAFMHVCKGHRLMDFPAIYASFGYFPPESDR